MTTAPEATTLAAEFEAAFGSLPALVVRAPGRANLIGEHTDYSHLPVLPIAIDRAVLVAAAPAPPSTIRARSLTHQGSLDLREGRPSSRLEPWHRYIEAAVRALEHPIGGASLLIGGDLPAEGGLSSSSALTMGSLAALNGLWALGHTREDLVRLAIDAERRVGVESGGMDQEVIAFAELGSALRIDFDPPARRQVPLPAGLSLVVAYSGETAAKGANAREAYNLRVVGCRVAAAMLADHLGLDVTPGLRLRDVAGIDVVDLLADELPDAIAPAKVAKSLGIPLQSLIELTAGRVDPIAPVPVRACARHVLSEAARVDQTESALLAGDLVAFGRLLNESHASLRDDYSCSTRALDKLCAAMRKAGALGARLTGAGFGGFALAACRPDATAAVIDAATGATGGPAFEVHASPGLSIQ